MSLVYPTCDNDRDCFYVGRENQIRNDIPICFWKNRDDNDAYEKYNSKFWLCDVCSGGIVRPPVYKCARCKINMVDTWLRFDNHRYCNKCISDRDVEDAIKAHLENYVIENRPKYCVNGERDFNDDEETAYYDRFDELDITCEMFLVRSLEEPWKGVLGELIASGAKQAVRDEALCNAKKELLVRHNARALKRLFPGIADDGDRLAKRFKTDLSVHKNACAFIHWTLDSNYVDNFVCRRDDAGCGDD